MPLFASAVFRRLCGCGLFSTSVARTIHRVCRLRVFESASVVTHAEPGCESSLGRWAPRLHRDQLGEGLKVDSDSAHTNRQSQSGSRRIADGQTARESRSADHRPEARPRVRARGRKEVVGVRAPSAAGRDAQGRFLFSPTVELFEQYGFTRGRRVGKHAWIVSRAVEPA